MAKENTGAKLVWCLFYVICFVNAVDMSETKGGGQLDGSNTFEIEIEDDHNDNWPDVRGFIFKSYNNSVTFLRDEIEHFGMSPHQRIGVLLIFLVSSFLLIASFVFLCWGACRRNNKDEDKFIVYRRMVEVGHIIALDPPKTDKGKMPI